MKTYVGIDLASEPRSTGVCKLTVEQEQEITIELLDRCTDEQLVDLIDEADMTGIDVPFGWPTAFVDAINHHHYHDEWTRTDHVCGRPSCELTGDAAHDDGLVCRDQLKWRITDRAAYDALGWPPLSVASSLLGVPALRMANIEQRLRTRHGDFDRTGQHGNVVEVYPAGSLAIWCELERRPAKNEAFVLLDKLLKKGGVGPETWAPGAMHRAEQRDDECDAVVAAFTAWAADRRRTRGLQDQRVVRAQNHRAHCADDADVTPQQTETGTVRREGWLHLPQPGSWPLTDCADGR